MISAKLRFTCKSQENEEPTTGPEPLSCSRYEKEWLHFGLYVIVAKSCRVLFSRAASTILSSASRRASSISSSFRLILNSPRSRS